MPGHKPVGRLRSNNSSRITTRFLGSCISPKFMKQPLRCNLVTSCNESRNWTFSILEESFTESFRFKEIKDFIQLKLSLKRISESKRPPK
jgi:hypothetical protein